MALDTLYKELHSEMMEKPVFTAWQSIPVSFIALAWFDEEFKNQFLSTPTSLVHKILDDCPSDIIFCGLENTNNMRHLVLPYRHPSTFDWSREQVEKQLRKEIAHHNNLSYGLPVSVILEAFFNPNFKRELIMFPGEVLAGKGYDIGAYSYFLHENTAHTSHLVLPENTWTDLELSYDQLEGKLIEDLKEKIFH